jgi:hypothetical protein
LGNWQLIVPLLRSWLDQWTAASPRVSEGAAIAVLLLPVALAILSKRMVVVLGCILLAAIAFCTFVTTSNMAMILAGGVYLGSLIVALSGISACRRDRALQVELDLLRRDVRELLAAEDRRSIKALKSTSEERSASISRTPSSKEVRAGSDAARKIP